MPCRCRPPAQQRARQMWDGRLQGVKAVVERQHRMSSEGEDYGLFLRRQDCRSTLLRPCRKIADRGAPSSLATVF